MGCVPSQQWRLPQHGFRDHQFHNTVLPVGPYGPYPPFDAWTGPSVDQPVPFPARNRAIVSEDPPPPYTEVAMDGHVTVMHGHSPVKHRSSLKSSLTATEQLETSVALNMQQRSGSVTILQDGIISSPSHAETSLSQASAHDDETYSSPDGAGRSTTLPCAGGSSDLQIHALSRSFARSRSSDAVANTQHMQECPSYRRESYPLITDPEHSDNPPPPLQPLRVHTYTHRPVPEVFDPMQPAPQSTYPPVCSHPHPHARMSVPTSLSFEIGDPLVSPLMLPPLHMWPQQSMQGRSRRHRKKKRRRRGNTWHGEGLPIMSTENIMQSVPTSDAQ